MSATMVIAWRHSPGADDVRGKIGKRNIEEIEITTSNAADVFFYQKTPTAKAGYL